MWANGCDCWRTSTRASFVRLNILRVGKQVHNDLRERVAVAVHEQRRRWQVAFEFEAAGFEVRAVGPDGFPHGAEEVAFGNIIFFLAAFQARKIEHVLIRRVKRAVSAVMMLK